MRYIDLLILILEAHAQALSRMAGTLGDETLAEVLDSSAEKFEDHPETLATLLQPLRELLPRLAPEEALGKDRFQSRRAASLSASRKHAHAEYAEIEGAVKDFHLGGLMEFHLWCFPIYRLFAESSIPLTLVFEKDAPVMAELIASILQCNEEWTRQLSQSPGVANELLKITNPAWVKFRASALRLLGQRPFSRIAPDSPSV